MKNNSRSHFQRAGVPVLSLGLRAIGLFMAAWTLPPGARIAEAAVPGGGNPSPAADLVRRLYEDGSWTARLSSFYVRSETIDTETPEGSTAGTPSGVEASKGSRHLSEFGFDRKRLKDEWRSEEGSISVTLWDGKEGIQYYRTKDHESYELCKDTGYWGWLDLWRQHQWADIGGYSFWWHPRDTQGFLSANSLLPDDFASVGREVSAGAECHVVESRGGFVRLFIGVADHRLRGMIKYVPGGGVDFLKVVRSIGGEKIKTAAHWGPWLKSLDLAEKRRAEKAYFDAVARKYYEFTFHDYRELGPGCWVPWKVRRDVYGVSGKPSTVAKNTSTTTILEVKAGEPLRDDFFRLEMKEGVRVTDYRFDLPEELTIGYAYKQGRTEVEFQALHEAERKDLAKHREAFKGLTAKVTARLGRRPCELPQTTWLNSKPLAWKDLEGKVVVLEFWAHDCGPCTGDFEVFGKDFKAFVGAGVTIIGVHTATTDLKDVEKVIESHDLSIPICIDAPGPEGKGFGAMTDWFGIDGTSRKRYPYLGGNGVIRVPYAVIVGKNGRVAAHGHLWEMLTKAREMALAPGGGDPPPPSADGDDVDDVPVPAAQPPASEAGSHRATSRRP